MDAITQNNNTPFEVKRSPQNSITYPLRWRRVLDLHLAGKSLAEIAKETDYTENSCYRILHHPSIQAVRQQMQGHLQQEFEALQGKVNKTIREGLDHPDLKTAALFTGQWLNANKKVQQTTVNITAEDVVCQMLNNNGTIEPAK